ncbi:MAG: hypothetical protein RML40_04760 [Bacteroidota bacterium]|nr:hypothetical protein [Candidatus Kapabacteria bacterium]MDW8219822.1 hypothetical protein [Bacteroidota bacterium]
MRTIIAPALIAITLFYAQSAQAQPQIVGEWRIVEAKTPNSGSSYSGKVTIRPLSTSAYTLDWETNAGKYSGFGLLQGSMLCVGWGTSQIPFGVVVYTLAPDKLVGTWTATGLEGKIGTETATRVRAGMGETQAIEGTYDVRGVNPKTRVPYEGTLRITSTPNSTIYAIQWDLGSVRYNGIGIRREQYLYVGWGHNQAFGVILYDMRTEAGTAQGVWAIPQENAALGIENLQKISASPNKNRK